MTKQGARILFTVDRLDTGGKERLILSLLELAQGTMLQIHLCLLSGHGELGKQACRLARNCIVTGRKQPYSPSSVSRIRAYVRENGLRLVHCNGVVDSFHAYHATRRQPVCKVCTIHGHECGWRLAVHKWLLKKFDAVVVPSKSMRRDALSLGYRANRMHVIPNCYSPSFGRSVWSSRDQTEKKTPQAVCLSRFDWSKDQSTVVRAMAIVKARGFNLDLDLIGSGEERYLNPVRELVKSLGLQGRINFLGNTESSPELLGKYDIMIASSIAESFGIGLVEGMVSGLPVVATNIPPFREILGNGEYGLLFSEGDHEALASILIRLLQDDQELERLSNAAEERAAEYSPKKFLGRLVNLYQSLLSDPRLLPTGPNARYV